MNDPVTVRDDLVEVLKELKQDIKEVNTKLDKQSEKLTTIEVDLAEIKTEVKNLKEDVRDLKTVQNTVVKEVSDLKGFRSLILPLIVGGISAVIGGIVTALFRLPYLLLKP
ncbi:shikimate dehydrogenase [Crocosphaera sp.]|uniref:shikimate dehydrogenase n=1 Tax=Crocosphaera sp. TaxID=2729996 RepID=UPI0026371862|nr:shikimate dehydrogenase [Crocosphaera sp.]MDJ0579254.1 shikimate dehydrogenase [Crocosphaera sp.]